MKIPASSSKPETILHKERRIFGEQIKRLGNCFLNKTFDLSLEGSQRRNRVLTILFLLLGFAFSLSFHPLADWGQELRTFFQYLFNPSFARANRDFPLQFINFTFGAILAPKNLRYLPLFILPFVFALQAAASYLDDIFEIKKIETAREFITQVALTGSNKSITIGKGDVAEKDKKSPVFLIGGPGQVVVELDTAALFEKPNGMPHVIGPTSKGKAKLEGFERFRQAIDLRDQYTDPLDVKSRSLDGIPVSTTDVRMIFSVWRGDQKTSAQTPYPFNEKAIETLVYSQASRVVTEGAYPSEPPSSWIGTIQGIIRSRLGGFMSKYRLTEYLSSIGMPEVELARKREDEIVQVGQEVISKDDSLEPRNVPPPPDFQARHIVSNLFSQFAEDFTKNTSNRGVQLAWIGVGTWKIPNEIVPSKHLEAWRLSRENAARGRKDALNVLRQEAQLQQTLRLIKNIPLARFQQNMGKEHKTIIRDMLIGYREQLIETTVILKKSNQLIPPAINAAIQHIEDVLGIHWVKATDTTTVVGAKKPSSHSEVLASRSGFITGVPSTPPIEPEVEELYQDLYAKSGQNIEYVEYLIEHERKNAPNVSYAELLQRAINHWMQDNH